MQSEAPDAIHVGRTAIEQGADSSVRVASIMTGALIARSAIGVRLTGPEARSDLSGLYLPRGHQRHDNVITVDHAASRCTSTQQFRGIVDDHGRGSFSGHVLVRPGTIGTDARQSNRNLVLAPTAQVDTRPWLEILADDVRCTHGATVGRLDEEALFYLRSRGIPVDRSRAMLVAAFAAEVIDAITPASLRDRVAAAFAAPRNGACR
jgi:Fe-S cluster assembly protein SufD